uniref:Uncharacterized protein n=1 Tax=Helianthus annuus TaxID=4232 RepID=A0A251RR33_HELAN
MTCLQPTEVGCKTMCMDRLLFLVSSLLVCVRLIPLIIFSDCNNIPHQYQQVNQQILSTYQNNFILTQVHHVSSSWLNPF